MGLERILVAGMLTLSAVQPAGAQREAAPSLRSERHRPANADLPKTDRVSPLVRMVEAVAPAVVNISTERLQENPYYRNDLFDLFLGGPSRSPSRWVENSLGSGVIVDPRGYLVTNEHVLAHASRIRVTFLDGRQVVRLPRYSHFTSPLP